MKIGISSPISINELKDYIYDKNSDLPNGLESKIVTELVKRFIDQGHEVVIFTLDKEVDKSMIIKGENLTICIGKYRKKAKVRALDFFRYERKQLEEFMKEYPCDVINAHWTYEFAMPAVKLFPNKTVVTVRDWAPQVLKLIPTFYRFIRYFMNNAVLKKAKYFTAVSPYIGERLNELGKKCEVIPNGINDNILNFDNHKKNNIDTLVAINNGFAELKNVKNTVKSFQIFRKKFPESKLILVGSDYGVNEKCYKWCEENGYLDNIEFKGKQSHFNVINILRKSDLLVHLSREESFGGILIEAMAQKTPVIGGENSGAVPWVLHYGQAGALCNVDKIDEIAIKIEEILKNNEMWQKLSIDGYKNVTDRFSISNTAQLYIRCFEKI